jgi:hypothetical protein
MCFSYLVEDSPSKPGRFVAVDTTMFYVGYYHIKYVFQQQQCIYCDEIKVSLLLPLQNHINSRYGISDG